MDEFQNLSHIKWECKYHLVFIPKFRRKTLYGELRRHLGMVLRTLAEQRECRVEEGHLMPDHSAHAAVDPTEIFGVGARRLGCHRVRVDPPLRKDQSTSTANR
jgi:putative transposase